MCLENVQGYNAICGQWNIRTEVLCYQKRFVPSRILDLLILTNQENPSFLKSRLVNALSALGQCYSWNPYMSEKGMVQDSLL